MIGRGFLPCLSVVGVAADGSIQHTDSFETVTNGRVDKRKRGVATNRDKSAVRQESTTGAECIRLTSS